MRRYDYSREAGDFHAENVRIGGGRIVFDLVSPIEPIKDVELGVPVSVNIENGIAAMALAQLAGAAIGLTLGLVNIVGIPVDNCSVNPARSFGPALYSINAWGDFWVMVVGPVIGAVLAALAWKCIIPNFSDPKAAK